MPNFLKALQTFIGTANEKPPVPPGRSTIVLGRLLLLGVPKLPLTPLPSDSDRANAASAIAQSLYDALDGSNIGYDRLVLYLPRETSPDIRRFFSTPSQVLELEDACAAKLFQQSIGAVSAPDRVTLMERVVDLHPVFDELLKGRLIVRALGAEEVLVSPEPSRNDEEAIQVLIGVVEITKSGKPVASEPIWAYRTSGTSPRIAVNFDFDLLAKGFPREQQCYPLGIDIRCLFQEKGGTRVIEEVLFEFSEAEHWLEHTPGLKYLMGAGTSGKATKWVDLRDYLKGNKTLAVKQESSVKGQYAVSDTHSIPLTRFQSLLVGASGVEYVYSCGFFPDALSFDPKKNTMSFTGQLVPREGANIAFAPSADHQPTTAFRIVPDSANAGRFDITIPRISDHTFTIAGNAVSGTVQCSLNDEIIATPNAGNTTQADQHVFRIQDLRLVPDEVLTAPGAKPILAFVSLSPPANRNFKLSEPLHIFGRGRHFPNDASNVAVNAIRFERPYLTLRMVPDRTQAIYSVSSTRPSSTVTGKQIGLKIGADGENLYLNANYDVYVGDFRLSLILSATPNSAMAMSIGQR